MFDSFTNLLEELNLSLVITQKLLMYIHNILSHILIDVDFKILLEYNLQSFSSPALLI